MKIMKIGILILALVFSAVNGFSETIHGIIVATTLDESIGDSVAKDRDLLTKELEKVSRLTEMELNLKIIDGNRVRKEVLAKAVLDLNPAPEDVVFFYFSGHGFRTDSKESQWPNMVMYDDESLDLYWIFQALNNKKPRMLFTFSDSCNNVLPDEYAPTPPALRASRVMEKEGYVRLFKEYSGSIIASSSIPGEYSMGYSNGGAYTTQFLDVLHTLVKSGTPSWTMVMDKSISPIDYGSGTQHPQYRTANLKLLNGEAESNTLDPIDPFQPNPDRPNPDRPNPDRPNPDRPRPDENRPDDNYNPYDPNTYDSFDPDIPPDEYDTYDDFNSDFFYYDDQDANEEYYDDGYYDEYYYYDDEYYYDDGYYEDSGYYYDDEYYEDFNSDFYNYSDYYDDSDYDYDEGGAKNIDDVLNQLYNYWEDPAWDY